MFSWLKKFFARKKSIPVQSYAQIMGKELPFTGYRSIFGVAPSDREIHIPLQPLPKKVSVEVPPFWGRSVSSSHFETTPPAYMQKLRIDDPTQEGAGPEGGASLLSGQGNGLPESMLLRRLSPSPPSQVKALSPESGRRNVVPLTGGRRVRNDQAAHTYLKPTPATPIRRDMGGESGTYVPAGRVDTFLMEQAQPQEDLPLPSPRFESDMGGDFGGPGASGDWSSSDSSSDSSSSSSND